MKITPEQKMSDRLVTLSNTLEVLTERQDYPGAKVVTAEMLTILGDQESLEAQPISTTIYSKSLEWRTVIFRDGFTRVFRLTPGFQSSYSLHREFWNTNKTARNGQRGTV